MNSLGRQVPNMLLEISGEITTTSDVHDMPSEGRQNENHNHRKLIKLITWTTALSNSMKP